MEPRHGGNLKPFAQKFGKTEAEILDFSSNVNPLGIPDSVRRLYPDLAGDLSRYPDPSSAEFRQEIARHFPVWPENVITGNGAVALLGLAVRTLAPKRVLLVEPCFTEYRRLLNLQGTEIRSVLLRKQEDFRFRLPEILNALRGVDLLMISHPNNPTGTALARDEMLALLDHARRQGVFTVVDEAFADWAPEISIAQEVKDSSHFLAVRSLTKFFALAGIRSGFALGAKRWIEKFEQHQEVWSCNRIAERLSVEALRDSLFQEKSRSWFRGESIWMCRALAGLEAFRIFPSRANFFLVKTRPPFRNQELFEFLGQRGICLRSAEDFAGLDGSYFRIALRTREENEILIQHLHDWILSPVIPAKAGIHDSRGHAQ